MSNRRCRDRDDGRDCVVCVSDVHGIDCVAVTAAFTVRLKLAVAFALLRRSPSPCRRLWTIRPSACR